MSMSKKDFIALADMIRLHNSVDAEWADPSSAKFDRGQIMTLADFCGDQNPNFNRERWLGYIAGTNGPSGGAIKPVKPSEWLG